MSVILIDREAVPEEAIRRLEGIISHTQHLWRGLRRRDVSKEQFMAWPVPSYNIAVAAALGTDRPWSVSKTSLDKVRVQLGAQVCTNCLFYAPQGGMGWHTNDDSSCPGYRVYISKSEGESIFRYRDSSGELVNSYDTPGEWTIRRFKVGAGDPFWHCVWTEEIRFSFGFMFPLDSKARLIAQ